MRLDRHPVTGRRLDWCESGVCDWCHCPSKNPSDMVVARVDGEVHEFCDDGCLHGYMEETRHGKTAEDKNVQGHRY